jgi:two-component sensor histidine kinase
MIVWSLGSFLIFAEPWGIGALFWNRFMIIGSTGMPLALFSFVQIFLQRSRRGILILGFLSYVIILVANAAGLVVEEAYVSGGLLHNEYGPALAVTGASWAFYMGFSALDLVRAYRQTRDALYRNRIRYLLVVIVLIFAGSLTNATALHGFPVDIAFNAVSAILIAYAIFRHQLLDISDVVRKGLLYSVPTIIIGVSYFLIIWLVTRLFHALAGAQIFVLSFIVAVVAAIAAQPMRDRAQRWVDRVFFRERYDSSLMLQRLSGAAAEVLDLDHITGMIVDEVTTTMHIERAGIMIRQAGDGAFRLMAQQGLGSSDGLRLRRDHPIVDWLSRHEGPLTRRDVGVIPRFKAMWGEEREDLEKTDAELFIPLKAKGMLVGILAVGSKLSQEPYSQDDRLTLTTLANQTAVAIENARLYSELQETLSELREAHDELEMRVQERTAELARANEALRAEVVERTRAEAQLKASLTEKEVLLKEIHHRVKNNLQIISGLLLLQSGYTRDREVLRTLQEARDRVHSMASIHEVLYQSGVLAHVDFAEYTHRLIDHLFDSYSIDREAIVPRVRVSKVSLNIDTAISCGLIINELVTNALKHAFPAGQGGEIVIDLHTRDGGQVSLSVSDNGAGLPPDVEFRRAESLGLQLVAMLTDQIGGTIELDKSGGTSFKIVFSQ